MPVGQLSDRTLYERPVVGRGSRINVFRQWSAVFGTRTAIGGVVLVVFQWLLTTADNAAMDGDRTDDVDGSTALWTLPLFAVGRRRETEAAILIEMVGSHRSRATPCGFGIKHHIERKRVNLVGGASPPTTERVTARFNAVFLGKRIERVVVGVTREFPPVFNLIAFTVAVLDSDVAERAPGNRVVVDNDALSLGVSPRNEYFLVAEAAVRVVGRALARVA
jgi:hypothetical protein